jgi:hypothetical protein
VRVICWPQTFLTWPQKSAFLVVHEFIEKKREEKEHVTKTSNQTLKHVLSGVFQIFEGI